MKKLNGNEFSDFMDDLRDLCHDYTFEPDFMGTEDGWSIIEIQIPREEEEEKE